MSDELKPSPFCGGKARLLETHKKHWIVCCLGCLVRQEVPSHDGGRSAGIEWNQRAATQREAELMAEIKSYEPALLVIQERDQLRERVNELEEFQSKVDSTFEKRAEEEQKLVLALAEECEKLRALVAELLGALDMADGIDGPGDELFWSKREAALAKAKEAL